ncbi:MAG: T9SS type A sorting domain-containing protein [Candidatus Kapabacteria bacterium]|nr:T9SS type A sorting domain-containing protein [Ignavibacteriota bacterium]MCW5883962.1 T9SS type A sorting domain-containing protein [Candidatus Kapabacteria bacterium]
MLRFNSCNCFILLCWVRSSESAIHASNKTSDVLETSDVYDRIIGTGLDLSTQRIDVSHLPAGVYFIRVGNMVEKFVKY